MLPIQLVEQVEQEQLHQLQVHQQLMQVVVEVELTLYHLLLELLEPVGLAEAELVEVILREQLELQTLVEVVEVDHREVDLQLEQVEQVAQEL
tara:strand:- start:46 stop:324 length:279 start_codon:yes stop_codon:yes gene_type:complete